MIPLCALRNFCSCVLCFHPLLFAYVVIDDLYCVLQDVQHQYVMSEIWALPSSSFTRFSRTGSQLSLHEDTLEGWRGDNKHVFTFLASHALSSHSRNRSGLKGFSIFCQCRVQLASKRRKAPQIVGNVSFYVLTEFDVCKMRRLVDYPLNICITISPKFKIA